ncbi:phosphoethanolamine transferase [Agrobacterium tumefaciens]|uniref:phosphoethanolamine transferase n=1 Tax=Agrobacterium tumefaciens TaxID=358 RepID=UPI0007139658|nr:sulfatase [Rhizobium sp. Root564]NTC84111.1 phosphoethanolamine--lipid A transferase [Agrobacterium tumefaciens]NTD11636.1 phosphoethanolamine--lipid A transferase [Agrobacterium tumefaciens]
MRFFKMYRPAIDSRLLAFIAALYFWALSNATFWEKATRYLAGETGALIGLHLVIIALFFALTSLAAAKYLFKPILLVLVALAGGASWFIDNLGVLIDTEMVRNVLETTPNEAGDLLTAGYFRHMILVAVIPSLLIVWVRVRFPSAGRTVLWNIGIAASCLAIIVGAGALYYKPYSAIVRTKRELVKTLNPVTPLVSIAKVALATGNERNIVVKPLGEDATVTTPGDGLSKPRVAIVIVGETARGANFSLGSYERETNPLLKKQDVTYYSNVASCGTATDVSLPCMFSNLKRSGYTHAGGLENETAVDVLRRAGINMTWIENNTGSKGVADRVRVVNIYNSNDPRFCADGTCDDEIVFEKIDEWLSNVKQDSVLVFHQIGNHGPAYYKRYPEAFRKFVPECTTTELAKCKDQEIVNAYDNAILYTDFVLSGIIDRLKARTDTLATGMLYVSDHGESLGENGLYLHGTPYFIAPDEQTRIPLLTWFSPEFAASMGLDTRCQQQRRENTFSHDNLFSSLLGMMNVSTSVYERDLDMFAACRGRQQQPSLNN